MQVFIDQGETNIPITPSDVTSYQGQLAAQGFSAQEITDARLVGLMDAEIEAYRQEIIAANPNELAGSLLDFYSDEAAISSELGDALTQQYIYVPGLSVGGSAGLWSPTLGDNSLAQIYNSIVTLQVGNPLTHTADVKLETRRIDLPSDWIVSVTPEMITLEAGEVTTVIVSVLTGSLVPQGAHPRVALEGKVGDQLLCGVGIHIVVPQYVLYDGKAHVYLPLLAR